VDCFVLNDYFDDPIVIDLVVAASFVAVVVGPGPFAEIDSAAAVVVADVMDFLFDCESAMMVDLCGANWLVAGMEAKKRNAKVGKLK